MSRRTVLVSSVALRGKSRLPAKPERNPSPVEKQPYWWIVEGKPGRHPHGEVGPLPRGTRVQRRDEASVGGQRYTLVQLTRTETENWNDPKRGKGFQTDLLGNFAPLVSRIVSLGGVHVFDADGHFIGFVRKPAPGEKSVLEVYAVRKSRPKRTAQLPLFGAAAAVVTPRFAPLTVEAWRELSPGTVLERDDGQIVVIVEQRRQWEPRVLMGHPGYSCDNEPSITTGAHGNFRHVGDTEQETVRALVSLATIGHHDGKPAATILAPGILSDMVRDMASEPAGAQELIGMIVHRAMVCGKHAEYAGKTAVGPGFFVVYLRMLDEPIR